MDINDFKELEGYYKCERCGYECEQISSIKRHFNNRTTKCTIKEGTIFINEKELYERSIIKKYKNVDGIKKKYEELKKLENENNSENKKKEKMKKTFTGIFKIFFLVFY